MEGRTRPGVVTLLAVLNLIGGVAGCLGSIAMFFMPTAVASGEMPDGAPMIMAVVAGVMVLFSVIYLVCGIGLWKMKSYGRTMQLVLSFVGLLGFPIGTVVSGLIIWYLFKPEIKAQFA
ncbi:MAG: hypothetical protein O7A63_12190 [Acidobacteria bacterium]|nr:hypothetical protein [Acidobacteriota bacterium]